MPLKTLTSPTQLDPWKQSVAALCKHIRPTTTTTVLFWSVYCNSSRRCRRPSWERAGCKIYVFILCRKMKSFDLLECVHNKRLAIIVTWVMEPSRSWLGSDCLLYGEDQVTTFHRDLWCGLISVGILWWTFLATMAVVRCRQLTIKVEEEFYSSTTVNNCFIG